MPTVPPTADLLTIADRHLVRTVDGLSDDDLATPSLLPRWTRGHVVAHLALNAEALERVMTGQRQGAPRTMYDSQEARDADIEKLATGDPRELRDRLLGSTLGFAGALAALQEDDLEARFDRTPGGQSISVGAIPLMRLREVEIHHADLGAGYTHRDWSREFCEVLVDSMTKRPYGAPFRVQARDLDRTWQLGVGDGGPLVTGDAADLGWWLTGRGGGESLASDSGTLPEVDAW